MVLETYIKPETLKLLLEIAEITALGPCGLAAANNDPQVECRKEWPDSIEDWCLSCMARQALEEYSSGDE